MSLSTQHRRALALRRQAVAKKAPEERFLKLRFQAQPVDKSLYNLTTKVGLYGEQHPE